MNQLFRENVVTRDKTVHGVVHVVLRYLFRVNIVVVLVPLVNRVHLNIERVRYIAVVGRYSVLVAYIKRGVEVDYSLVYAVFQLAQLSRAAFSEPYVASVAFFVVGLCVQRNIFV